MLLLSLPPKYFFVTTGKHALHITIFARQTGRVLLCVGSCAASAGAAARFNICALQLR